MKHTKDRMGFMMPTAEINALCDVYKDAGATHVEIATVIGHPNFVEYSKRWADVIRSKGMSITWRCAHANMEGLYNFPRFVGGNKKPAQFWVDEAVNAANQLEGIVRPGDEWAIYPERTEGIFDPNAAWISEGLPGSYAETFIKIHTSCKQVLPEGVIIGRSANNASELLSGWMPKSLADYAQCVVIDHYRDGDAVLYEKEIRDIRARYAKPVYVQEGAPHRFSTPNRAQADLYYAANKRLADDGVLIGFGSWSGWSGNPESIINKTADGKYALNDNGLSLKAWWDGITTIPTPTPVPVPTPTPPPVPTGEHIVSIEGVSTIIALTNKGNIYKFASSKWTKLPLPTFS